MKPGVKLILALVVLGARVPGAEPKPDPSEPQPGAAAAAADRAHKLISDYLGGPVRTAAELVEIGRLVVALGADSFEERETASARLVDLGEKALPELQAAVKDEDPEVATRAEVAIEEIQVQRRQRRYDLLSELRRMKDAVLPVIDERVRSRQEAAAEAKKRAAGLKEAGREGEALTELASAKAAVDRALALAELRKEVETGDPLERVKALIKKGDRQGAIQALQAYVRDLQANGAFTPERQKEYMDLFRKAARAVK